MRLWIGLIVCVAGCSGVEGRQPAGVEATQSASAAPINCVEVGGGELQKGLRLGLAGGDVTVTAVQHKGTSPIGFTVSSTAPNVFFIVTAANVSCSDGSSFVSGAPITRVDFCTGVNGCI